MQIIKGKIDYSEHVNKYDDDGIEYKLYTITIDKKKYTSKLPKGLYLVNDVDIIAGINPENPSEIIAGYCPVNKINWGKNTRSLKRQTDPLEIYEFVEGTVLEKRKSSSVNSDFSRDTLNSHTSVSYMIYIEGRDFNTSHQFGHKLKPGMEIAAVLQENSAVLVVDKKTGRITGKQRPYFILLFLMLVAFNVAMYYVYYNKPDLIPSFKSVLIVINVFLVLFWALSIYTFLVGRKSMKFLNLKLKK